VTFYINFFLFKDIEEIRVYNPKSDGIDFKKYQSAIEETKK
jgi:hypothetical protein